MRPPLLLPLLLAALLPSGEGDDKHLRLHRAEVLKLKCAAYPFRTSFINGDCYIIIEGQQVVGDTAKASRICKDVSSMAQLSVGEPPADVYKQVNMTKDQLLHSNGPSQATIPVCVIKSPFSCPSGSSPHTLPGRCLQKVDGDLTFDQANKKCRAEGQRLPAIHDDDTNRALAGLISKGKSAWIAARTGSPGNRWRIPSNDPTEKPDYWRWQSGDKPGGMVPGPQCSSSTVPVLGGKSKERCSRFGYWNYDSRTSKNEVICTSIATSDYVTVLPDEDIEPPAPTLPKEAMVDLESYYSVKRILHAYCTTDECRYSVFMAGLGYECCPTDEKETGVVGGVVRSDKLDLVKKACPDGWRNLKTLSFVKNDQAFKHSWMSGSGFVSGYASLSEGVCGATVPVKAYSSCCSKDVLYTTQDMESNKFYQGRELFNGTVQFWLWPA